MGVGARANRHALLSPVAVNVFQRLDVGLTLWRDDTWFDLYGKPVALDVLGFELEHGAELDRASYNRDCLSRARRTKRTVVGERWGMCDLFVPVRSSERVDGVLVLGPYQTRRPSSTDIQERWHSLTGSQGDPTDPEFAYFVAATLATLVVEGARGRELCDLLELMAKLCAGQGDAGTCLGKIEQVYARLAEARLPEHMWEAAHASVDARTSRAWASTARSQRLLDLGLRKFPEHAAVGLFVGLEEGGDPVDELLRRDGYQRACAELARQAGGVLCGQVGDYGITLLAASRGSSQRTRRHLLDVAESAASLARRRFGLRLHLGVSTLRLPLPEQYQAALAAAESGLSKGSRLVHATSELPSAHPLALPRRELAALVDEKPRALSTRFERYLEAVAVRSGYRVEPARAHLEAAFERIAEAFRESGQVDARSFNSMLSALEREAREAASLSELFAAYRRAVGDVVSALTHPVAARRDRSLRRAEEYLRVHYQEPVTLERVARVAGFAPSYFSELLHKKQGVTFARYLIQLRLERAKQLLSGTPLSLQRVAQLSGFSTRFYLGRVFKRLTGVTPRAFRRRAQRK